MVRDSKAKWSVSSDEYEGEFYPDYCNGFALVLASDLASRLSKKSAEIKFFWIDDVFVTGIVRQAVNASLLLEFNWAYVVVFDFKELVQLTNEKDRALFGHLGYLNISSLNYLHYVWQTTFIMETTTRLNNQSNEFYNDLIHFHWQSNYIFQSQLIA